MFRASPVARVTGTGGRLDLNMHVVFVLFVVLLDLNTHGAAYGTAHGWLAQASYLILSVMWTYVPTWEVLKLSNFYTFV